jgi:general secretion pathway protein N
MKKKKSVGSFGLAVSMVMASMLAAGELVAQINPLGSQAAVDTNSLQGGFGSTAPDPMSGAVAPIAVEHAPEAPRVQSAARVDGREPRGNPLWAIPLKSLTATRERPIFLPSRRPPAPLAVAAPPPAAPPPPPPPGAPEPERPRLSLVGAVVGDSEAIAIFFDQSNQGIIRLRTGENHLGWTLSAVKGREATLQKGRETIQLALPAPNETQGFPGGPMGFPGMRGPALGGPGGGVLTGPPRGPGIREPEL